MRSILVPFDGSDCSDQAVREIITNADKSRPMEIHLINVQPPIFSEPSLIFLPQDKLATFYLNQGERAFGLGAEAIQRCRHGVHSPSCRRVDCRNHPRQSKRTPGRQHRNRAHGRGKVAGLVLGSVSLKVLHLSDIPVTVVGKRQTSDFGGRIGIA